MTWMHDTPLRLLSGRIRRHTLTASLAALAVWAAAAQPADAQSRSSEEPPAAAAPADPIAAIPGIWIRDERLSEDPIEKLEETYGQTFGGGPGRSQGVNPGSGRTGGFGRGGFGGGRSGRQPGGTQDGPAGMREMARELAERLDVLLIRIDDPQLLIRNAKREDRILYLDGRDIADGFGGRSRARFVGDSLEVETASQGRQRIETFYLEGEQLVLVTDLQGGPLRGPVVPYRLRALGRRTGCAGSDVGGARARNRGGVRPGRVQQGGLPAAGRR